MQNVFCRAGWAFASAINSLMLTAGTDGLITMMYGTSATIATGAKSRSVSNGSFV